MSNDTNPLVTLPESILSRIGSYLSPRDRNVARVSRGLSIPFSRQPVRAFRITERRTIKYARNARGASTLIREFGFFSDPQGVIKSEDVLKVVNYEANMKLYDAVDRLVNSFPYAAIWGSLPEAWKEGIDVNTFSNAVFDAKLRDTDICAAFCVQSLWSAEELYTEIMRRGNRTLVRSKKFVTGAVLDNVRRYNTVAQYNSAMLVWNRIYANIERANPHLDLYQMAEEYVKFYDSFPMELSVEISIEHFNVS